MPREAMIPLSAVVALIERQESFNAQLIDKLGLYLEKASENYKEALNPPLASGVEHEMRTSSFGEEGEDLLDQIERGIIDPSTLTPAMQRMIGDTQVTYDP